MPISQSKKDFRKNVIYSIVTDRILPTKASSQESSNRLAEVKLIDQSGNGRARDAFKTEALNDSVNQNHDFQLSKLRQYVGGKISTCTNTLIPYLVKHNITALHLTPLFTNYTANESDQPYHGYWISNLTDVDPHFGTWADFETFAEAAKNQGIDLILDVVLDHTNPRNAPGSAQQGLVMDNGKVLTTWESDQLQQDVNNRYYLNNGDMAGDDWNSTEAFQKKDMFSLCKWRYEKDSKSPAEQYVFENLKKWLRTGNFSGVRIDAFRHCPDFAVKRFVEELREEFDQLYIYGEWYGGGLGEPETTKLMKAYNGSLQFLDFPLQSVLEESFVGNNFRNLKTLGDHLTERQKISRDQLKDIEHQTWQPIFIDNHDMTRILSRLEAGKDSQTERGIGFGLVPKHAAQIVEMYLTALMTIPGIPIIYYGTEQHFGSQQINEVGHSGGDPFNREPMDTYLDTNLTQIIDRLAGLRKHNPVLQRGLYQTKFASEHVLCFERFIGESQINDPRKRGSMVLVGFNTGPAVSVELTGLGLPDGFYRSVLEDNLNCAVVPHCRISAHQTKILMPMGSMFVFAYNHQGRDFLQLEHSSSELENASQANKTASNKINLKSPLTFQGEHATSYNKLEVALSVWKDYPLKSNSLNDYWQAFQSQTNPGQQREAARYVPLGTTRHLVPSLRTRDHEIGLKVREFINHIDHKNTPEHMVRLALNLLVDVSTDYNDIPCLDSLKKRLTGVSPSLLEAVDTAKNRIRNSHCQTIVFVSVEARPWLGTGGLGNVMGELPKALRHKGHNPVVIIPFHQQVKVPEGVQLEEICKFNLDAENRRHSCNVFFAEHQGVKSFLIANEYFFNREGPYSCYQDESEGDGAVRYDFFSRAAKTLMETQSFIERVTLSRSPDSKTTRNPVDIVQLNDHHAAPLAYYLSQARDNNASAYWSKTNMIFAVHNNNPAYQGIYSMDNKYKVGFGQDALIFQSGGEAEYHKKINYYKLAFSLSDAVGFVSRQFMLDSLTHDRGVGLEGIAIEGLYQGRVWGVLNGIDETKWDPQTDSNIIAHYSMNDSISQILKAREDNKADLQQTVGLKQGNSPVFGMVARLVQEKGFDAAASVIPKILNQFPEAQFVFCGDGQQEVLKELKALQAQYPNNIIIKDFSVELERKIIAGSDVILVFSDYEPCGLPQIYAMRYGSLPWVHAVGGLEQSIAGKGESGPEQWTGLKYRVSPEENLQELFEWLGKDVSERSDDLLRIMQEDFSWSSGVVPEYLSFYRHMHNERAYERYKDNVEIEGSQTTGDNRPFYHIAHLYNAKIE